MIDTQTIEKIVGKQYQQQQYDKHQHLIRKWWEYAYKHDATDEEEYEYAMFPFTVLPR